MAWTAATRGRLCARERELCERCDGSGMGADHALSAGGPARRAAAVDLPPAGGERDLLPAAGRLPIADAAAGLSAARHPLRLLLGMDRQRVWAHVHDALIDGSGSYRVMFP